MIICSDSGAVEATSTQRKYPLPAEDDDCKIGEENENENVV